MGEPNYCIVLVSVQFRNFLKIFCRKLLIFA
uniref:Uncharacterized protein n=1 Tax=Myoviridae sp. ct4uh47 TaxID=2825032 RepID=A0A8S5V5U3_9CAUD|nr:MAG TPA: hypothetical protein [Myoviridae sp. ct4uh47]